MREYTIQRVQEGFDWRDIPVLNIDHLMWTEKCDVAAWAQICYDVPRCTYISARGRRTSARRKLP